MSSVLLLYIQLRGPDISKSLINIYSMDKLMNKLSICVLLIIYKIVYGNLKDPFKECKDFLCSPVV